MKLLLSLAALLVGCAPALTPASGPDPAPNGSPEHSSKLNESPRAMKARAVDTVAIYRTKVPGAEYVEVSELDDTGDDEAAALDQLKRSAAGVGCDGLIVGGARPQSTGSEIFSAGSRVTAVTISGTCIMFKEDPGTWRPSPMDARCAADRDRLFAAKDPDEKVAIARSMPPDCHR